MTQRSTSSVLIAMAAVVIVLAAVKMAKALIVPMLLALFVAIICMPLLRWLMKRGMATGLSVTLTVSLMLLVILVSGALIGASVTDFSQRLPVYQQNLQAQSQQLELWLDGLGISVSGHYLMTVFDPSVAMRMAGTLLTGFGNMLTNSLFIILMVIFLLFEFIALPHKWQLIQEHAPNVQRVHVFLQSVNQYLAIKTIISLITGVAVGMMTSLMGLDYPILWAFLAFVLNFVPNIGSILAAIPAVLLALVQLGAGDALTIAVAYIVINVVMGNVIEPKYLGRGVGLSTLVVFLSLVFWGWLLGPVGMLLSIPLTMIVKLALESDAETRWVAVLLGPDIKPDQVKVSES